MTILHAAERAESLKSRYGGEWTVLLDTDKEVLYIRNKEDKALIPRNFDVVYDTSTDK